MKRYLQSCYL